MATPTPKTGFPDLPIDPARADSDNQDLLGLDPHAAALASFIKKCSTPMTIGIQGDWGSGKTSLMNLIRAKLAVKPDAKPDPNNPRILSIWFNTWQYAQFGKDEQLASSMLVTLMQKIKLEGRPSKRVLHNVMRFVRGVVQAAGSQSGLDGRAMVNALEGKLDLDDAGLFELMKSDFADVVSDVRTVGLETSGFDRIVIFVDDLDRLAPAKAVELLEAVKNLIDVEGCVFVLAIDYDVVIRGLRARKSYGTDLAREDEGKSFFDKIIQVPYQMPVERYQTQNFLTEHYQRVYGGLSRRASKFVGERAQDLIRLSVGNNPRSLKRALNIHSLFSHLIITDGEVKEEDRIITLVLAFIQVAMPDLYSVLSKQARPFHTLVALRSAAVHELLGHEDESQQFERVAELLVTEIRKLLGSTDDDDSEIDQLQAELRTLVGDLRRHVGVADVGRQRRIRALAEIVLDAVDLDDNEIYDEKELDVLDKALRVTRSTSVNVQETAEDEGPAVRRHVGFKELSESLVVFAKRPALVFYDPSAEERDDNIKRMPDYDTDIARFNVIVDGSPVRLKDETLRVLERLAEKGARELSGREARGTIQATDYWMVEGDDEERTITALREEWKTMGSGEIDTRTLAGRNAYDARVLAFLRARPKEYVPARDVEGNVGGTIQQVRTSLNRLIEQGLVTWEGRARGTRYKIK